MIDIDRLGVLLKTVGFSPVPSVRSIIFVWFELVAGTHERTNLQEQAKREIRIAGDRRKIRNHCVELIWATTTTAIWMLGVRFNVVIYFHSMHLYGLVTIIKWTATEKWTYSCTVHFATGKMWCEFSVFPSNAATAFLAPVLFACVRVSLVADCARLCDCVCARVLVGVFLRIPRCVGVTSCFAWWKCAIRLSQSNVDHRQYCWRCVAIRLAHIRIVFVAALARACHTHELLWRGTRIVVDSLAERLSPWDISRSCIPFRSVYLHVARKLCIFEWNGKYAGNDGCVFIYLWSAVTWLRKYSTSVQRSIKIVSDCGCSLVISITYSLLYVTVFLFTSRQ